MRVIRSLEWAASNGWRGDSLQTIVPVIAVKDRCFAEPFLRLNGDRDRFPTVQHRMANIPF